MKLINFVLFQLGWFISVWGAANQKLPLSMMVVALILLTHIMQASRKKRGHYAAIYHHAIGLDIRSVTINYKFSNLSESIVWYSRTHLDCGYVGLFATTLNLSLSWLKSNRVLAVLFGFIGGPVAYFAAEQLNAVQLTNQFSIYALALGWGILTPVCLLIAGKWNGFRTWSI